MVSVIASSVRKGNVIEKEGKLYLVLTAENIHPGKGTPVTHLEMRRISDGVKTVERLRTTDSIEKAFVEHMDFQYLYQDGEQYVFIAPSADVHAQARVVPPCYIGDGARVDAGARVGPLVVLGAGSVVGEGATVLESVVQERAAVGAHAQVERSVMVRESRIGAGTQLSAAVLGEGCAVGAGNRLAGGICLYPGTSLPDNSVQFQEQLRGREG